MKPLLKNSHYIKKKCLHVYYQAIKKNIKVFNETLKNCISQFGNLKNAYYTVSSEKLVLTERKKESWKIIYNFPIEAKPLLTFDSNLGDDEVDVSDNVSDSENNQTNNQCDNICNR